MDVLFDDVKSLIRKNFKNYIAVPSLAEADGFHPLTLCLLPSRGSWWSRLWKDELAFDSIGQVQGYLRNPSHYKVPMIKEDVVGAYNDEAFFSTKFEAVSRILNLITLKGHSSKLVDKKLKLGTIKKNTISYSSLDEYLLKMSKNISPEITKEAAEGRLFVVYESLTAEKLESTEVNSCACSADANENHEKCEGSLKWEREQCSRLSRRTATMGQFPIAYRCGPVTARRIRVFKSKSKRKSQLELRLKLAPVKRFYDHRHTSKPLTVDDKIYQEIDTSSPSQSPPSSPKWASEGNEQDISVKAE